MLSWTRATLLASLLAASVVGLVACSLNPQPLPPQDGVTADGGFSSDASASEAAVPFSDAAGAADGGTDLDSAPPATDAGDASDAGDAGDAAKDGGDAGDASTDAVSE